MCTAMEILTSATIAGLTTVTDTIHTGQWRIIAIVTAIIGTRIDGTERGIGAGSRGAGLPKAQTAG
jgi:hypothetical protein